MSDSLERLYLAVIAAKDLDPATSRTARLFQRGPAKMAKKLAEEAIEVVIDAVNGKTEAVVRESADLLYNLTVLWASAGVQPEDVWREMERREHLLGIAEKLPKSAGQNAQGDIAQGYAAPDRPATNCRARGPQPAQAPLKPRIDFSVNSRHGQIRPMVVHRAMLRRIYDWCIDAAHKPYALWIMGAVSFAESSFFPVPPDMMLIPMSLARPERAWLYAAVCTVDLGAGRHARLCHRRAALRFASGTG